ncbi:FadR/GntR family transcriptional regulator [Allonocardiopsis opalescens]|uniref:DNA-binding FadR family transcriptional regulator n=1 Tax=Allonocardiopsis opalescens TaxID=1144618 RepID=A0A2T0QF62_9ACTN|nr:FCD domain-containing protein [Allonocardiopsis opalescens]PRY02569.1 DNA-binding FadR family transcriptional regulator [Allonocardiopsis opalescens]
MRSYKGRGLHGQVVEAVGRRIVQGHYTDGLTLDMEELRREHDVSLTVIRETLKVLAAKGLVDARQRRGTFVLPRGRWNLLDPDILRWEITAENLPGKLEQLAEVRAIFEPAASALAATRREENDISAIEAALAAMEAAADPEELTRADLDFHRAVLAATKNDLLGRVELVTRVLLAERDLLVHQHVATADGLALHRSLFESIAAGAPADAARATERLLGQALADENASITTSATGREAGTDAHSSKKAGRA